MVQRLERRLTSSGQLTLPAVPSMAEDYAARCTQLFAALGRHLSASEQTHLRSVLENQLHEAFTHSQRSNICISYEAQAGNALNYRITPQYATIEETYEAWTHTRKPPYFGMKPDTKVMAAAMQCSGNADGRVLDIGAGTGRNAIALARLGFGLDAVEITPVFAQALIDSAQEHALDIRVICKDVFEASDELARGYKLIILSEVVSDFRTVDQLRSLLELAAEHLSDGGLLVFNAFITQPFYCEDNAAREFAQQVYSAFFTPEELSQACAELPLEQISVENVYDFEKNQVTQDEWPPTAWYPDWVSGRDVFDTPRENCPICMQWVVMRKTQSRSV